MFVRVPDPHIIAVDPLPYGIHRVELRRDPRVARVKGLTTPTVRLLCAVWSMPLPSQLANLLRKPTWQRLALEWVPVGLGRPVGGVRVPVVHVQEPVVLLGVAPDPLQCIRRDLIGDLSATRPGIVHLSEASVPVPRGVALAERTDCRCVEAGAAQGAHPARPRIDVTEAAPGPLDEGVRCRAAVVHHPGVETAPPAPHRCTRGEARGIGIIAVLKAHSLPGQCIHVGAGIPMVAIAAQVIGSQRVDVDVQDPHRYLLFTARGRRWRLPPRCQRPSHDLLSDPSPRPAPQSARYRRAPGRGSIPRIPACSGRSQTALPARQVRASPSRTATRHSSP